MGKRWSYLISSRQDVATKADISSIHWYARRSNQAILQLLQQTSQKNKKLYPVSASLNIFQKKEIMASRKIRMLASRGHDKWSLLLISNCVTNLEFERGNYFFYFGKYGLSILLFYSMIHTQHWLISNPYFLLHVNLVIIFHKNKMNTHNH